jgi:putative flippase GtrA
MANGDSNRVIKPASHSAHIAGIVSDRACTEQPCPAGKRVPMRTRLAEARRYLSVGVICAALHNIIVITAAWLGLYYMFALLLSFIVVTPTGYVLHSLHTFSARFSWKQFARFTSGIIAGVPLALAIMFVLCTLLHVAIFIATPIATIGQFAWNYLSARWAVLLVPRQYG